MTSALLGDLFGLAGRRAVVTAASRGMLAAPTASYLPGQTLAVVGGPGAGW
jgi:hypothetical protein